MAYADPTATDRVEGLNKRQAAPLAGRRLHFKKDNIDVSTFTIPAAAGQAEETEKASTPWKDDDREWFAARPFRSHRLRALFSGEPMKSRDQDPPDAHHEIQVLVRQLAPGQRLRLGFWRNTECPIPILSPCCTRCLTSCLPRTEKYTTLSPSSGSPNEHDFTVTVVSNNDQSNRFAGARSRPT